MGPRYAPFDGRPQTISMGLRPLGGASWLEPDARRVDELAAKAVLLRTRHADVVASLQIADDASQETLELVEAEVAALGLTDSAEVGDAPSPQPHPIDAAGRLVQEDLCVMVRDHMRPDGRG